MISEYPCPYLLQKLQYNTFITQYKTRKLIQQTFLIRISRNFEAGRGSAPISLPGYRTLYPHSQIMQHAGNVIAILK
jgi:hypothetical protein